MHVQPFGYRTVDWLLGFNKNTAQRVFQLKGWQVRKRPIGMRPRVEALASAAKAPNERWSTAMAGSGPGEMAGPRWPFVRETVPRAVSGSSLFIDCHTCELLGWYLSRSGKATTASSVLEHALISRFGTLGRVNAALLLRSDNGLVFTSRRFTALVRSYGRKQELITPHCP